MKRNIKKIIYYSINIVLLTLFVYLNILVFKIVLGEHISTIPLIGFLLFIIMLLDLIVFAWLLTNIVIIIYAIYMWLKEYDNDTHLIGYIKYVRDKFKRY